MKEAILASEKCTDIVSAVLAHGLPFFDGPVKANLIGEIPAVFDELNLLRIFDQLRERSYIWVRTVDGRGEMCFNLGHLEDWLPESNGFSIYLPGDDPATLIQVTSTIDALTEALPIRYAAIDLFSKDDRDCGLAGRAPSRRLPSSALNSGLRDVFWYNYLGPEYVSLIGKEKFRDLPMASVMECRGGYRVVLNEPPAVPPSDAFRTAQAAIRQHLGSDLFADERLDPTIEGPEIRVPDFYAEQRVRDEEHRTNRRKLAESLARDESRIPTSDILNQARKKTKPKKA